MKIELFADQGHAINGDKPTLEKYLTSILIR